MPRSPTRHLFSRRDALTAAAAALAPAACSSKEAEPDFPDSDLAAKPTNPYGVAYPTDGIGRLARAGTARGQRMPNLAFQAFVDGDRSRGLSQVQLADFFDPEARRYRVLLFTAVATWCSVCSEETHAATKARERLTAAGVGVLQAVVNGNTVQLGPSQGEVEAWITRHDVAFTVGIDVRARRVYPELGVTNVPHNFLVDTRTMEILESAVGAPRDLEAYVAVRALSFVEKNPPSY